MIRFSRIAASILVSLGLLFAGGCAQAPHVPGVLRLAQVADPFTLDPARAYDTSCTPYVRLLYRGLLEYTPGTAELKDEMAESHEISADGLTYTFRLRPNLRFHSGAPVTAEDFRFALERVLTPATQSDGISMFNNLVGAEAWIADRSSKTPRLEHIAGIEVPDARTIVYHLKKPDLTFLNLLALPFAYAVPKDYVLQLDRQNRTLSENPNGDGPFRFKEWVHDAWVKFDKNPDYFRPGVPKANRIEIQVGINPTLGLMLFEQGRLDVYTISDAYPPEFLRLKTSPKWKPYIKHAPMMDIRYVALNNNFPPFDDVRVRQAVNYAVDRKRIASFLTGRAIVARGDLPPGMPGYDPHSFMYTYNPDKARALLKAAKYKPGPKPITLWYSISETFYEKAAQSIQNNLRDVGIPITLSRLTYGELKDKAGRPHGCEMAMLGWLMDYPDPSNFLDILFNKKSIQEASSLNRSYYNNPRVNKLLDEAAVEVDAQKRLRMYQEIESQVVHDAPLLFMVHTERYMIHQPWVSGFQLSTTWAARYENVAVN